MSNFRIEFKIKNPELDQFLGGYGASLDISEAPELDEEISAETISDYGGQIGIEQLTAVIAQSRAILADPSFPVNMAANKIANRYFETEEQARKWLTRTVELLEMSKAMQAETIKPEKRIGIIRSDAYLIAYPDKHFKFYVAEHSDGLIFGGILYYKKTGDWSRNEAIRMNMQFKELVDKDERRLIENCKNWIDKNLGTGYTLTKIEEKTPDK